MHYELCIVINISVVTTISKIARAESKKKAKVPDYLAAIIRVGVQIVPHLELSSGSRARIRLTYCFTAQARKNHATLKNIQPFGQTFSNPILPITLAKRFFMFLLFL